MKYTIYITKIIQIVIFQFIKKDKPHPFTSMFVARIYYCLLRQICSGYTCFRKNLPEISCGISNATPPVKDTFRLIICRELSYQVIHPAAYKIKFIFARITETLIKHRIIFV